MNIYVSFRMSFSSFSRFRICASTDTSREETDSSQIISSGSVASARANAVDNVLEVDFQVADGLAGIATESCDLVLCNPPFHQDRTVGDLLARRMLQDAHRVLRPGGELRLVGNRHLGYHARLTDLFGGCALVAEDRRFSVLSAARI